MEVNLYLEMLTSEKHRGRKKKPERRGRKGGERPRTRKDEKVPRLLGNFKLPLEKYFFVLNGAPSLSLPPSPRILMSTSQVQMNKISLFPFKTYNKRQYVNEESQTSPCPGT